LWAVISEWVAFMSGIASVAIAVWLQLTKRPWISPKVFWLIGGLCLFFAFFSVWRKEHILLLTQQLQDRPNLIGELIAINHHLIPAGLGHQGTAILAVMQIKNLGADSIVENYEMSAVVGGNRVEGVLHTIPRSLSLTGPSYKGSLTYYGKDSLYDKTSSGPVRRGSKVVGILWAWFEGVPGESVDTTTLELRFKDVAGKSYSVKMGEIKGHVPGYYPGLSQAP